MMARYQHRPIECGLVGRAAFSASSNQPDSNSAANRDTENTFRRLQASFKGLGHRLTRTIEPDGAATYFVGCGSFSREVASIHAAGEFLKTIGGAR